MRLDRLALSVALLSITYGNPDFLAAQTTPSPGAASMLPSRTASKSSAMPVAATGDGPSLATVSNVSDSITVDAILLPPSIAKRIFGKEVSDHYAVVQLTISNHNQNAALILQSTLLDYSHWLFSNNFQLSNNLPAGSAPATTTAYQAENTTNQIASAEARLVRGDLEDAQLWTWRNGFIRGLTAVGTIATGYQFLASSTNYLSGISAFGNDVVPAIATFWPDRTQLQINRVSDFGFQTNHVIAKGSSDIVVAFFPLDRFITPSLRKIYLKSPAVFFVPGEMLLDAKYVGVLTRMLRTSGVFNIPTINPATTDTHDAAAGKSQEAGQQPDTTTGESTNANNPKPKQKEQVMEDAALVSAALGHYERIKVDSTAPKLNAQESAILGVLDRASLNNIRVVVGGIMTVDVNAVPATITCVTFTADPKNAATWKSGVTLNGTIAGSFLSNGTPTVTAASSSGAAVSGIGTITVDTKKSTDKALVFTFTLSQDIPTSTTLSFTVTKQATDKSTTTSAKYDDTITYTEPAAATDATSAPKAAPATTPAGPAKAAPPAKTTTTSKADTSPKQP